MTCAAIIDARLGNLDSMRRAIEECGHQAWIASEPGDFAEAERLILPGVGAFPDAMQTLDELGFSRALRALAAAGEIPILGVCLGMQLLFSDSDEVRPCAGLDLIPGQVRRLKSTNEERIPHIGWNAVDHHNHPLFAECPVGSDCYFVHSYHCRPSHPEAIIAETPYCGGFVAAIAHGAVYGVQFHPEKSHTIGLRILRNFLESDDLGC